MYGLGEVWAIDKTAMDRVQASQQYGKRTDCTFELVKTSILIDRFTNVIIDI